MISVILLLISSNEGLTFTVCNFSVRYLKSVYLKCTLHLIILKMFPMQVQIQNRKTLYILHSIFCTKQTTIANFPSSFNDWQVPAKPKWNSRQTDICIFQVHIIRIKITCCLGHSASILAISFIHYNDPMPADSYTLCRKEKKFLFFHCNHKFKVQSLHGLIDYPREFMEGCSRLHCNEFFLVSGRETSKPSTGGKSNTSFSQRSVLE